MRRGRSAAQRRVYRQHREEAAAARDAARRLLDAEAGKYLSPAATRAAMKRFNFGTLYGSGESVLVYQLLKRRDQPAVAPRFKVDQQLVHADYSGLEARVMAWATGCPEAVPNQGGGGKGKK